MYRRSYSRSICQVGSEEAAFVRVSSWPSCMEELEVEAWVGVLQLELLLPPHRAMSNLKCKQVLCKHAHCYAQFKPEPKWSMRSVYHSSSFTSWLGSPLYLVGVIQQMLFCFKLNNFSQPLLCGLLRGLGSRFIQPKGMVSLHCVYRELVVRGSFQDGENLFADVQEVS